MDFIGVKERISECARKFKYAWIILLLGMLVLLVPGNSGKEIKSENNENIITNEYCLQDQLEKLLSRIEGVGKVDVLLSIAQGERTIYQTDSTYSQSGEHSDSRTQTIIINDSGRNESGLIHQRNPPIYKGALILCQGADIPSVKLSIVDAVSKITGLGADKISVLKMH
jgi:stage III sporulation protein AG